MFKEGQKVRVRPDLLPQREGGYGQFVNSEMIARKGKEFTIRSIRKTSNGCCDYYIELKEIGWRWTEKMFLPPYENEEQLLEALINEKINESIYNQLKHTFTT